MPYQEPTYEEYKKATAWARVKYRYSLIVVILCFICFILLIYFVWSYGEEMAANPFIFGSKKLGIDCKCNCYNEDNKMLYLEFNSSSLYINKNKR